MIPYILTFYLTILLVPSGAIGYFLGGTMSYSCLQNTSTGKTEVHIDMITGWRLGDGPCGANCSTAHIGETTSLTRQLVEKQHNDPQYFGNWSLETNERIGVQVKDITNEINLNLTGEVLSVSDVGKWEQEQATIIYTLDSNPRNGELDIVYEVFPMPTLPLQTSRRHTAPFWHLQAKIDIRKRSDTGRSNSGPVALLKPVYRLRLDQINQIRIPVVDPDGDIVKCFTAKFSEAGLLSTHILPGLSVEENCTVTINATSSLNYTDGLLGGIAVKARDYNKQEIYLDGNKYPPMWPLSGLTMQYFDLNNSRGWSVVIANLCQQTGISCYSSLLASYLKFLVHVVDTISEPVFVQSSPPVNDRYNVYLGSTWEVTVYAKASINRTIQECHAFGRLGEKLNVSNLTQDDTRHNVWYVTVSWKPESRDVGGHVFCVRAIDNTGVDTVDDRCFIVDMKLPYFKLDITSKPKDDPHFVNLPSTNETLKCDVHVTCIFPIYVNSTNALKSIQVEGQFDILSPGPVYQAMYLGNVLNAVDLSIMNHTYGMGDVCLTSTDIRGATSDRVCLQLEIIPVDPCLSSPCQNSAKCSRKSDDPTDYQCHCINGHDYEGKNCELKENKACESNPCKHGARCLPHRRHDFFCFCRGSGYEGPTCDQAVTPPTTKPSLSPLACSDAADFPCHSNFNMCSDKTIAEKYCKHTCNLCDGDVAFVG